MKEVATHIQNENGKSITISARYGGDLVHISIAGPESESSWEITPNEARAIHKALGSVLKEISND